jgi:methyl-accepting chemotaxis protein
MNSWFANLSVMLKLALGFSVVLVLTTLLAVTGWSSLSKMIDRTDRMTSITELNARLDHLRRARLQYLVEKGDEQKGTLIQASLEQFVVQQKFLAQQLRSPENLQKLAQIGEASTRYQTALNAMREAYRNDAAMRKEMGVNAVKGAALIGKIIDDVEALPADDERRYGMLKVILKAKEDLALVRYEVRGYTGNPNSTTEQAAARQMDNAIKGIDTLNSTFGDVHADTVKQLETALLSYRRSVLDFTATNQAIIQAVQVTVDLGETIS